MEGDLGILEYPSILPPLWLSARVESQADGGEVVISDPTKVACAELLATHKSGTSNEFVVTSKGRGRRGAKCMRKLHAVSYSSQSSIWVVIVAIMRFLGLPQQRLTIHTLLSQENANLRASKTQRSSGEYCHAVSPTDQGGHQRKRKLNHRSDM